MEQLFYDRVSGSYFKSNLITLLEVQNKVNERFLEKLNRDRIVYLNDYYKMVDEIRCELGLESYDFENDHWELKPYNGKPYIDCSMAPCVTEDNELCIVLDFDNY